MPSTAKRRPTDGFLCEMVTFFYQEAYSYQPYLCMTPDDYVKVRINDTKLTYVDKQRALELVQD